MINSGRERKSLKTDVGQYLILVEREFEVRCGSILNSGRERERVSNYFNIRAVS